ncbi:MAG: DEAD/DEAH box helicase [Kiritimatiellaeota bacterium]|nr:DEAD/DEAH box helicase [Kiritimatiellota bacterium]
MPLTFLKKLADRLLSKAPAGKGAKAAPAKKDARPQQGRGANPGPKQGKDWAARPQRGGGRHPARGGDASGKPRPAGDAHKGPRKPRHEQQGQAPAQQAQPPHEKAPRQPQAPSPQGGGHAPAPHGGGRSIARPERSDRPDRRRGGRGGRGGGRDGRGPAPVNTAAGEHRPGGAVEGAEVERRRTEHAAWDLAQYQVPEAEGKKRFHDFDLPLEILHAVADMNFQYCTPIQQMSLEHALAGKNVAGRAQTGTGKTAAFLVAILTRYLRSPEARQQQGGAPRALVIAPTRELVIQICKDADALGKYCGLRSLAVYGGMDYDRQRREVQDAPVDLLVATPGRLLDFVRSRVVDLSKVDTLVIDEADRMLDMGFIPDVRSIIHRLPPKDKRCTMLYSATLGDDVMRLAAQWMEAPVRIEVESDQVPTDTIKQIVYVVTSNEKFTVLYNHIQQFPDSRILVFCNRKSTTEDVAHSLSRRGIACETLSGDVNQNRRLRVLEDFREGKVRLVIATDVAGRGLHVDDIGFVINFDFPYAPEDYVHRIGRTGRAGQSGTAISFADEDESFTIPEIEKFIGEELKCTVLQPDAPLLAAIPAPQRRGGAHRFQLLPDNPQCAICADLRCDENRAFFRHYFAPVICLKRSCIVSMPPGFIMPIFTNTLSSVLMLSQISPSFLH